MPGRRILVVDDDPRLLRVVSMYLTIEGFDVATAADGEEALEAIAVGRPALVILDVMMAGMDGLETCRRIKAEPSTRSIPVILLSALTRDADVARGRSAGADRYMNKPFSLVGLSAVVRGLLEAQGLQAVV